MAQAVITSSRLALTFETGFNEKGEPIYKTKSYNNIKIEATADQLFQGANALGSLTSNTLVNVERNDNSEIIL
ncbi:DUF1659 domain-containing protein [Bacillus dakarensis]|uniref:DUF1659 domain-containing protein n=1 Tax=Robertmurraya dakarensis TaxID=1926278 RepID=UPI000980961C|nr:DUF1659 domain-containing protein [Bacillus dakarensis]